MGFRILLVGVVAGLGLTLPSSHQFQQWKGSAFHWVDARLTQYDSRMPTDETAFVVVASEPPASPDPIPTPSESVAQRSLPEPAIEIDAETPATTIAIVSVPGPVPAEIAAILEDEQGLDTPTRPVILDQSEAVTARVPEPLPSIESPSIVETTPVIETVSAIEPLPAPEAVAMTEDAGFDQAQAEFLVGVVVGRDEIARVAAAEETEIFASLDADDELDSGLASGRNREEVSSGSISEGTVPAVDKVVETLAIEREGRLTTAVRLTRDAVYAWSNLLHGPAVVTIGR